MACQGVWQFLFKQEKTIDENRTKLKQSLLAKQTGLLPLAG
jgi:hypothetical protein